MSSHDDLRLALERPISRRSVLRAGLGLAAAATGLGALESRLGPVIRPASAATDQTPVVTWDKTALQASANVRLGPTADARALAIVHTCMYDAWTTYDAVAVPTQANGIAKAVAQGSTANKTQAISYAAYRACLDLFPSQKTFLSNQMQSLGYNPNNTSTDTTTPAGVGNVAAQAVLNYRHNDGSNQANGYADYTGFPKAYGPYPAGYPSTPPNTSSTIYDPNRWQPLRPAGATQDQTYLTPHWGLVKPFCLTSGSQFRPAALVPQTTPINGPPAPGYVAQAQAILTYSANLTDTQKMIAEFWRPGTAPTSGNVSLQPASTPPGMWCQFGQFVSQRDNHDLDADVKMFFALANALFDASIACWDCKRFYNYVRPITAVHWIYSGRFAPLYSNQVSAWAGPCKGTQTIAGSAWQPYQPANVVTPPFPEFTSGHSTFSAAGAAVLAAFTGSPTFGGTVRFAPGSSSFESACTPQSTVTLSWPTFTDAAVQAGQSREYGGIHFIQGDDTAVQMGTDVGNQAYTKALTYFTGTAKPLALL
jgi:membrane-associated phospholipid phosphatase